jgi:hypothetical protein
MNIDDLTALYDNEVNNLPNNVGAEMRADMNKLSQGLKSMIDANTKAEKKGKSLVYDANNAKLKADFLVDEFKMKYGSKGNK